MKTINSWKSSPTENKEPKRTKDHIEGFLEVLSEHERDQMAQVQRIRRGTTTSVQVKRLLLLVAVQNVFELTVREEYTSTQKMMHWSTRQLFNTIQQSLKQYSSEPARALSQLLPHSKYLVDARAAKFLNQFVVINTAAIGRLDVPRINDILGSLRLDGGGGRGLNGFSGHCLIQLSYLCCDTSTTTSTRKKKTGSQVHMT
jgi:hypothetical protein